MKYYKIDEYLSENECTKLIQDAHEILQGESFIEVQNFRKLIPSASLDYSMLINKSQNWSNLHNKISSQKFLNNILEKLKIEDKSFRVTNFFHKQKPGQKLIKYKSLHQKKLAIINTKSLLKYTCFRIFREICRIFKFKFTSKKYVELLYDYSISPNGYKREIHRDSDARTFVFLLYLNNLSQNASGGDLEIYKYKKDTDKIPARPKQDDCEMIEKISPKPGRLVVFLNSHKSLHAVSEMKNHNGFRHFLYGSFTLLAKKNQFLSKSHGSLGTEYNLFD